MKMLDTEFEKLLKAREELKEILENSADILTVADEEVLDFYFKLCMAQGVVPYSEEAELALTHFDDDKIIWIEPEDKEKPEEKKADVTDFFFGK